MQYVEASFVNRIFFPWRFKSDINGSKSLILHILFLEELYKSGRSGTAVLIDQPLDSQLVLNITALNGSVPDVIK